MIYRIVLYIICVLFLSGCYFNTTSFTDSNVPLPKSRVKASINTAIIKSNEASSMLSSGNVCRVIPTDKRTLQEAKAKFAVMFDRAKLAVEIGKIRPKELFYIWNTSVDAYVEAKIIANIYVDSLPNNKFTIFKSYEDLISLKGDMIEKEFLRLDYDNGADIFVLIMEQAEIMNKLIILILEE